jgi:N-methylhydantoinase B
MSTEEEITWDGVENCYIPPEDLRISPMVKLNREQVKAKDIDPITYEVIRHRLWRAIWDGGLTCSRMCASPLTLITRDLQAALYLENGDCVFFGPYLQYMAGMLEPSVKWILENRGEDPGINEDDMFIHNDPWIGTVHQGDVGLLAPVFIDGNIFAWTAICEHQNDIGGVSPGSFCLAAQDIWSDPQPIPPIKIIKGGKIDRQFLDLYKRMSRTPYNLELDLRAAIAGNTVMKNRIIEIIDEFGYQMVKGVMLGIIDSSEESFLNKIKDIPDGTWTQTTFMEHSDRFAYRIELTMEKRGNELYFTNEGTETQVGAINLTYAGWRGAVMAMLSVILLPEQMGAIGGAMRHCHFNPVPGTIICPTFGAAVSTSAAFTQDATLAMVHAAMAKMLLCSRDEAIRNLVYSTTPGFWPAAISAGVGEDGEISVAPYGIDNMIGSSAASLSGDGVFGGGVNWIPDGKAANSEENERNYPCFTLWRKMVPHSSIPGKFISGESAIVAFTAHDGIHCPVFYVDEEMPCTPGIFGLPGTRQKQTVVEDSNLQELFDKGEMPSELKKVKGKRRKLPHPREELFGVNMMDLGEHVGIYEWSIPSCSGFGDPLARDPERVRKDVINDRYTNKQAEEWFGVVLKEDMSIDKKETEEKRQQLRNERLAQSVIPKEGKP